ncbi:MAG: High-affinity branched-chain amino acid transport ATP-binding protein LivF [Burkholderiaceae bacterium]|nr:High-affinity branched-chain amino acid transport ATP-binding protein LivF [Burkholderiaceae bacterium]
MANPLLEVRDLDVAYGDSQALWGVSIDVPEGAIVALVGANGAGKSTLLKAVSGLLRPRRGRIVFRGQAIGGVAPQDIVAAGLCHVPEGRGLFTNMTVLENLELGAYPSHVRPRMRESLARTFALFPRLDERQQQKAGLLSGGEQQMLAIGRAIMAHPVLLVLDEPSMGLSPLVVKGMFDLVRTLNEQGVTILLVEQNVHQALQIADHAFVLQSGRVVMQGAGRELLADPAIREAYIGSVGH